MNRHESPASPEGLCSTPARLPVALVQRWARPFVLFLQVESASGVVLLACTVVALALANSPWAGAVDQFWHTHVRVGFGGHELDMSLLHWINDALMTIFFFVVGLEVKRELVAGELRDPRKAALPLVAALGGMVAPAGVYLLLQYGQPGQAGWGIPMATDIAFVVGFLALLGKRVPFGLKILLLTLAIADDIGAILVIGFVYSKNVSFLALGLAGLGLVVTYLLNRVGVRRVPVYVVVGALVWLAVLQSGVHPTVAGVMLGLLTPASAWVGRRGFLDVAGDIIGRLRKDGDPEAEHERGALLGELGWAAREAVSPLERLETSLHPWVAFLIMPVFALANAGVALNPSAAGDPLAVAVALGLALGKPLGIVLFSWVAVRAGLARLPEGVNWRVMLGAGCLAGIGFTMSLFIANLALEGGLLDAGKIGTLTGSAVSAVLGCVLLVVFLPRKRSSP